jgi:dTDP-4-dehydrorhamnose 3,5-epimerase-like enzyme
MSKFSIEDCRIVEIPRIDFGNGSLHIIENHQEFPFKYQRLFFIYDIPGGKSRGAHAHKQCHQFLCAPSGSYSVMVDDGNKKSKFLVSNPDFGFYVPPGIWAAEVDFSAGAVCLVMASDLFNEKDYIREYSRFLKFKKNDSSSL